MTLGGHYQAKNGACALAVGLGSGVMAFLYMRQPGSPGDYFAWWTAAQALLAGQSPYAVIPAIDPHRFATPFFYPLPTVLLTVPFAFFPFAVSGGVFVAVSSALLAYGLLRHGGWWALVTLLSPAYLLSVIGGTWTIPLTAAAFLPWLGFVLVAKPNLAAPLWLLNPAWLPIVGGALLVAISFLLLPTWLTEWLADLRAVEGHPPPIVSSAALCTLFLLLRPKLPASWFVIAMACMPQQAYLYDQLPLWAVPESKREYLALTIVSALVYLPWVLWDASLTEQGWHRMEFVSLSVHYVTVTIILLRRPLVE